MCFLEPRLKATKMKGQHQHDMKIYMFKHMYGQDMRYTNKNKKCNMYTQDTLRMASSIPCFTSGKIPSYRENTPDGAGFRSKSILTISPRRGVKIYSSSW